MKIGNFSNPLSRKQADGVSQKEAEKLLMDSEKIEAIISQYIPVKTKSIILTNDRIIVYDKDVLKRSFKDYFFRDIKDVHFSNDIAKGGKIIITSDRGNNAGKIKIDFLPVNDARDFYVKIQKLEKVWFSKKREMELEDKRASSGASNVVVSSGSSSDTQSDDIEQKLKKLKNLKNKGLIDEETYKMKYTKLIELL